MHAVIIPVLMGLLSGCQTTPDGSGDFTAEESEPAEGATLELSGGLRFESLGAWQIAYTEPLEGHCERPAEMWMGGPDSDTEPRLHLTVPFEGPASKTHAVGAEFATRSGTAEADQSVTRVSLIYVAGEQVYPARAGNITTTIDGKLGSAIVSLSEVSFEGLDSDGETHEGSVLLDLLVSCKRPVLDAGGSCAWLQEAIPFSSDYCVAATSEYIEDVWSGPAESASED